jgi:hypothetical protein
MMILIQIVHQGQCTMTLVFQQVKDKWIHLFPDLIFIPDLVDASLATSLMVVGAWLGCLLGSAPSEVPFLILFFQTR